MCKMSPELENFYIFFLLILDTKTLPQSNKPIDILNIQIYIDNVKTSRTIRDQVMLTVSTLTTTLFKFLKTQQHKIVNMASPF